MINFKPFPICPIHQQNDTTVTIKEENYSIGISAPGYNQTTMIPLIKVGIFNAFFDLHYGSTEKQRNLVLTPKFGEYPIKLSLYPLKDMNFDIAFSPMLNINEYSAHVGIDSAFHSSAKKGKFSVVMQMVKEYLIGIGAKTSFTNTYRNNIFGFFVYFGRNPIYLKLSVFAHPLKKDEIVSAATKFANESVDLRGKIIHSKVDGYKYKASASAKYSLAELCIAAKGQDNFKKWNGLGSLKIAKLDRFLEFKADTEKNLKLSIGGNVNNEISISTGVATDFFRHKPLFNFSLTFDKST